MISRKSPAVIQVRNSRVSTGHRRGGTSLGNYTTAKQIEEGFDELNKMYSEKIPK